MDDRFNNLTEFKNAIEMGLDIVFYIGVMKYNISWKNQKPFICVCPDGDAAFYEDADALLSEYTIDGKKLKDLWNQIRIDYM